MTEKAQSIVIREAYKDFVPPVPVVRIIRKMLSYVPEKYLGGLHTIVLTNAAGLNYQRRREKIKSRKHKVQVSMCRGLYYEKSQGEPAYIEIFVDNIVNSIPKRIWKIPPLRDVNFAEVLFHEIGHHIHKTKVPEYKEPENVADSWGKRLEFIYYRRRFWYLRPFAFIARILLKPFLGLIERKIGKFR